MQRAAMSTVKLKVRFAALLLTAFTADDLVRTTGLNRHSVRTELGRMRREGLVTSAAVRDVSPRRGRRPVEYALSDDSEVRLALAREVESFHAPVVQSQRPTSPYYAAALDALDRALVAQDPLERRRVSREAEEQIELARRDEGGSLIPERIAAYLRWASACVACLREEYGEAEEAFHELEAYFGAAGDEGMMERIAQWQLYLLVSRSLVPASPRDPMTLKGSLAAAASALAGSANMSARPLTAVTLGLLRQLSALPDRVQVAVSAQLPASGARAESAVRAVASQVAFAAIGKDLPSPAPDDAETSTQPRAGTPGKQ